MRPGYIEKSKRKKILLLSDDLRLPSGVGIMSKEIVVGLCHKYNFAQIGGAIQHPEQGKIINLNDATKIESGVEDPQVTIYPTSGYGNPIILRQIMDIEKPDAILHFTDPRFWIWLYQMEAELRTKLPLLFYHIWDDLPYPKYNENYYRSCDWIASISKQTYNIVKNVWVKEPLPEDWQLEYIGHGVDHKAFHKAKEPESIIKTETVRNQLFQGKDVEFSVLYNNRNIHRKQPGNTILAFQKFIQGLPEEKRSKCRLVMHTQMVDENGTDLPVVFRDVAPDVPVIFSEQRLETELLNALYNVVDCTINLASAEGFGLATMESLMAETMIIANVTGGLQDQMGFTDEKGEYLTHDKHFSKGWGSNHNRKFINHGDWVVPVFPNNLTLIGTPPTPYIFDDRCDFNEAARAIREVYDLGPEERARRGMHGRGYALTQGFSAEAMCEKFDKGFQTVFEKWTPRARFTLHKV